MSIFQTLLQKLPDAFAKRTDSNLGRLLLIVSEQIDQLNETFDRIERWRNIDEAEGVALDDIADNYNQRRGQATDEILRVLIRARIARNRSDGTMNSIINTLARSLNTDPSTIRMKALHAQGEPAALMIEGIPLAALNRTGMTVTQFAAIVQQVVGAGVRVASIDLSGTFTFSSQLNALETSAEFGFAPLDSSVGGDLGATFDPNEAIDLPL